MDRTGSGYYVMGYISCRMSGGWNWLRIVMGSFGASGAERPDSAIKSFG